MSAKVAVGTRTVAVAKATVEKGRAAVAGQQVARVTAGVPQGTGGSVRPLRFDYTVQGGEPTLMLPGPTTQIESYHVNGLLQRPGTYTVVDTVVSVFQDCVQGDWISILYYPG